MGTNAEFPPFEYVTDQGLVDKFDGIDVAIAQEIANSLGKTLKIENMEFDSLITALATGKVDFVAAGMTVTPDRTENVLFGHVLQRKAGYDREGRQRHQVLG